MFFFYDPSWSESSFILFLFFYSIRVGLSWSYLDWQSQLIRSDFCTCLGASVISFHTPPPPGGGTASSFSSQITNSWGQGCLNSQAPAKEIKIGGQMDGAVGIDLCIRKSSSLSICFFGWDALNNLITHIQVRHSIKIFTQFWNSSRSY